MPTTLEKATFPDLGREQCIALTTFRKTGQAVTTPVWFAISLGTIYVETHADAGKLKRLRHTARVTLAPCTYSGKVTGSVSEGNARILTESEESKAKQGPPGPSRACRPDRPERCERPVRSFGAER